MIEQLELQTFLFEGEVSRLDLLNFVSNIEPSYRIAVYRNHSFELIENTIKPYLEYGGYGVEFCYSSYDDSLSFLDLDLSADLLILWLDLSNYKLSDLRGFIMQRIEYLRQIFDKDVLFIPCGKNVADVCTENLPVAYYALSQLQASLGDKFYDLRLEAFAGTKLSHQANLEISRDLGLNYLPALLSANLKAIVVDLDNSIYQGVLGEDGVDGVLLSQAHRQLQIKLKKLSQQGFLLCIASKNDKRDVVRLFDERSDFPLNIDDFVKVFANWDSKAKSITSIAESLNIAVSSLVFIDDNVGELVSVLDVHPEINVIWARDDASITHQILSNFPGLLRLDSNKEDGIRRDDILANEKRAQIQSSLTKDDYIRNLKMELLYEVDELKHVTRVAELSNKTNQFIFSYQRYSEQQVQAIMADDQSVVVTVSLCDKLSDSGIIGAVVLKRDGQIGVLAECFVSCRALGRGIDEAIVLGGINVAMSSLGVNKLQTCFTIGERNFPAKKFSEDHFDAFMASPGKFDYQLPVGLFAVTIKLE